MKKVISIVVFLVCFVFAGYAFGSYVSSPVQPQSPTTIESAKKSKTLVFRGIIKRLDDGTALFTEKEVYPLLGGDFDMIVGKEVNVIGKVIKEGNVEKIIVARVQFKKQ